jgi:RecB family exonuclease
MSDPLQFLLTPDRAAARRVRRALAEQRAQIGVAVGSWPDLFSRAMHTYMVSVPPNDWADRFADALRALPDAFWSRSLEAAPDETVAAVEASFLQALRGLPPGARLSEAAANAGGSLPERVRRHLADLARLHDALEGALPEEMVARLALLAVPPEEACGHIVVLRHDDLLRLDAWQKALIAKLSIDAGAAGGEADSTLLAQLGACLHGPPRAPERSALGHLQRRLFGESVDPIPLDESVQWLGVRDALEEVEVAAGMVQHALDQDPDLAASDFALLLPNDAFTRSAAHSAFTAAGLPLAGLESASPRRDLAHEAVSAFLLCQRSGAPAMALATLLSSPLHPWDAATGMALADQVMNGRRPRLGDDSPEEAEKALRLILATPPDGPERLAGRLHAFAGLLSGDENLERAREDARELCGELAARLSPETEIPWDLLEREAAPRALTSDWESPYTLEGVTVLDESLEPWRAARRLIVVGCAAGHYPADVPSSPVFTDSDLAHLVSTGFDLATGADILSDRRARFKRQLAVASEEITFLVPRRSVAGDLQALSSSLAFMTQHFEDIDEDESLVIDIDSANGREAARGLAVAAPAAFEPPRTLLPRDLALGRNLLAIGAAEAGELPPLSPSRLETLLVSPFAWVLERADLLPREWSPESLDPLIQGTLAHAVFERLFAADVPLPSEGEIREQIPGLLHEAIVANAAFALHRAWGIERFRLEQDIQDAALVWRRLLAQLGARVLACEVKLEGWLPGVAVKGTDRRGLPLRGTADVVLAFPDGALAVVDYKKSRAVERRTRMRTGFDLQASLYRAMLETGGPADEAHAALQASAQQAPRISVLYYTMNDQTALADGAAPDVTGLANFEAFGDAISEVALATLKKRVREVERGHVVLNHEDDEKELGRAYGVKLYALEMSPILRIFLHRADISAGEAP